MPLHEHFERARAERPFHIAVVDADGGLTYTELGEAVDRTVGWLCANDIVEGERVVYSGGNDRRFLAVCYATLRLGAVFVPLHPDLTATQTGYIVGDAEAALTITWTDLAQGPGRTLTPEQAWSEIGATEPDHRSADIAEDDLALLIYTSGTTGNPKGVMCPHRQVVAALHAIDECLGYSREDVVLCRLPLSFDYGLYQALLCSLTGGTLVLTSRDAALLRLIERYGVTVIPLVPSIAQMLIMLQRRHRRPTAVRLFTNTGARLGRDVAADLLDLFPGSAYASMYGMTECKRISILSTAEYAEHPDSVGSAIPGDTIRIVDAGKRPVPTRTVGEIVVSGTTVMAGYWRTPPESQLRYLPGPDGRLELHTGDQGYLDEEGRLYFVGRDDDVVKRHGIRVGLAEIEDAAESVPGVAAAVALRPSRDDGPLRLAVLGDTPLDDVREHLARLLDRARMPDQVIAIASVPLSPNGKPDRTALARLLDHCDTPFPTPTPPIPTQIGSNREPAAV